MCFSHEKGSLSRISSPRFQFCHFLWEEICIKTPVLCDVDLVLIFFLLRIMHASIFQRCGLVIRHRRNLEDHRNYNKQQRMLIHFFCEKEKEFYKKDFGIGHHTKKNRPDLCAMICVFLGIGVFWMRSKGRLLCARYLSQVDHTLDGMAFSTGVYNIPLSVLSTCTMGGVLHADPIEISNMKTLIQRFVF